MKKLTALLLSALCILSWCTAIPAHAECSVDPVAETLYIKTDTFSFTFDREKGMYNALETDLIDLSYNIDDWEHGERILLVVSPYSARMLWTGEEVSIYSLPDDARAGDLMRVKVDGIGEDFCMDADCSKAEWLGNGIELFGEEFEYAIRFEMYDAYSNHPERQYIHSKDSPVWDTVSFDYGDANWDGSVDIMDAIYLNKYLLGSCSMLDYSKIVCDTNADGTLDATDSLNLLKTVVGMFPTSELPVK